MKAVKNIFFCCFACFNHWPEELMGKHKLQNKKEPNFHIESSDAAARFPMEQNSSSDQEELLNSNASEALLLSPFIPFPKS